MAGRGLPGVQVSDEQIELLQCLYEDLLPTKKFSVDKLIALIEQIAKAVSYWNRRTQLVINEFYMLTEASKEAQAQQSRRSFIDECPSAWYRGIVRAL